MKASYDRFSLMAIFSEHQGGCDKMSKLLSILAGI